MGILTTWEQAIQGCIWFAGLILFFGCILGLAWLWPRIRIRRAASRACYLLGPAQEHLPDPSTNQVVTLRGRLLCPRHQSCQRFEDGQNAAAVTMWGSVVKSDPPDRGPLAIFSRAPKLHLMVGDTPVFLDGPIAIHTGSEEWHPGHNFNRLDDQVFVRISEVLDGPPPFHLDRRFSFCSVQDGDLVQVRGKVSHRVTTEDNDGYRQPAGSWSLGPYIIADTGTNGLDALEMTFEGRAKIRGPTWSKMLRQAMVGLLVAVPLFGILGLSRGPRRSTAERVTKIQPIQWSRDFPRYEHAYPGLIWAFNNVLTTCRSDPGKRCPISAREYLLQQERATGIRSALMTYCLLMDSSDLETRSLAGARLYHLGRGTNGPRQIREAANEQLYNCLKTRVEDEPREELARLSQTRSTGNLSAFQVPRTAIIHGLTHALVIVADALGHREIFGIFQHHLDPAVKWIEFLTIHEEGTHQMIK